jgi:hypothetical protein
MQLKRYTIAAFILMILVAMATYTIDGGSISFDLLGIHFPNLPVALWVVVPVVLMFLASLLHMAFYALMGSVKLRRIARDSEKMTDALRDAMLGVKGRNYAYKSDTFKTMGKLIDNVTIVPFDSLKSIGEEKIDEALVLLQDINENKKVDLKKFNLGTSCDVVVRNNLNRLERGELSADEVLSKADSFGDAACAKAYEMYVKTASIGSVLKYKRFFTVPTLLSFVERINSGVNGIEITNEELIGLFGTLKLDGIDFINISEAMSKNALPEQRIRLFEMLSEQCDDAMNGYFYTLYDLQMVDTANEVLNNTAHDEYQIFKAYRDLKRANKHYDIALFFRK